MGLSQGVQDMLAATMRWSGRHAWPVIGVVALITIVAGTVLATVEPNVETDIQAGYFATHDEQANMFRDLRENVAGVNSEIVYFELKDDARATEIDCSQGTPGVCDTVPVNNVTSMEALAAQEELFNYVKAEFFQRTKDMGLNGGAGADKVVSHTSLPFFEKLIYKQYPNGCFCLAPTTGEHDSAQQLLSAADSTGAIALYRSDDFRSAVMFIIYEPSTEHLSKKETGGLINEIIDEYRALDVGESGAAGVEKTYDLWKDEYFDSWGVQSWIYRIDEQVQKESVIFIAAVFGFLTLTLLVLFRNVKRTLIGVTTVGIILLWTLAGMTLGHVSIGFVSMAMFPLLLGVGVDYVIHIINEFGTERAEAGSSDEAFDLIGRRGAVALFISTLTTISGFVVMITSTSPMIVEIGTATIAGIGSVFILSLTFIPALLQLSVRNEAKEVMRPSNAVAAFCTFWGRNKAVTIVLLLVVSAVFASFIPKTEYVIGTVEVNLPQKEIWTHEDDRAHMLDMYEQFQIEIKSVGQETVITKAREPCTGGSEPCGLATRAAVDDMIKIHKAMVAEPFVQASGGAVNSVPFILNLYALLKDGLQTAGPGILEGVIIGGQFLPCEDLPAGTPCGVAEPTGFVWDDDFGLIADWDDTQIRAAYDDMLARDEWKPLLLTFMSEDYNIAWALTFVNLEVDQDATIKADAAFHAVVDNVKDSQETQDDYFGTLTGIKKYNDYTNKWLTLSSAISLGIVAILVLLFTGSWRAVGATVTPMIATFVWWLGALPIPAINIDLAFIFMIPIAFITSLGSDYAVHLTWNLEKNPDAKFVFRTVGKAVVYSGFTTVVSFFIFTRGAIRGSYEMFQAAVIAILLMTAATLISVPLFYVRRDGSSVRATRGPGGRPPQDTP